MGGSPNEPLTPHSETLNDLPSYKDMSVDEVLAQREKLTYDQLVALDKTYLGKQYDCIPVVATRADGPFIYDLNGKRYFDFLACFGAVNQGHCHPKVVEAVKRQMDRVTLSGRAFFSDTLSVYSKFMCEFFGYQRVIPMNSGVEAVETALKLVRRWGYEVKKIPDNEVTIIFCEHNFAGRTISTISASVTPDTYEKFGPFTPGFEIIPYNDVKALEAVLERSASKIAGFIVEPLQGEAGVKVPCDGYLRQAYDLCKKHNVLFVADEIQSGLGRTGKMLCCDHENVRPDILCLAKALSAGLSPVSAVLTDDEVALAMPYGTHGSTFGGNPLACTAAIASLCVLRDEKLAENAEKTGKIFREEALKLKEKCSFITDVRGKGLMNAIQVDGTTVLAWDICEALLEVGIMVKPTHHNTIRFTPPLVITEEQMREATSGISNIFMQFPK